MQNYYSNPLYLEGIEAILAFPFQNIAAVKNQFENLMKCNVFQIKKVLKIFDKARAYSLQLFGLLSLKLSSYVFEVTIYIQLDRYFPVAAPRVYIVVDNTKYTLNSKCDYILKDNEIDNAEIHSWNETSTLNSLCDHLSLKFSLKCPVFFNADTSTIPSLPVSTSPNISQESISYPPPSPAPASNPILSNVFPREHLSTYRDDAPINPLTTETQSSIKKMPQSTDLLQQLSRTTTKDPGFISQIPHIQPKYTVDLSLLNNSTIQTKDKDQIKTYINGYIPGFKLNKHYETILKSLDLDPHCVSIEGFVQRDFDLDLYNATYNSIPIHLYIFNPFDIQDPIYKKERLQELIDILYIHTKLNHPNMVKYYGCVRIKQSKGMIGIVLERLTYKLTDFFEVEELFNSLTDTVKYKIIKDISDLFSYLHTYNPPISHGNFSVYSVYINDNWTVKVNNIGGKRYDSESMYYAPEIYTSPSLYTPAMDIYAFGVFVCQLFWQAPEQDIMYTEQPYYGDTYILLPCVIPENIDPHLMDFIVQCFDIPVNRPSFPVLRDIIYYYQYTLTENQNTIHS
ncbi:hypothetical protein WA158_001092 [Blastocystis sp. Blastoise]